MALPGVFVDHILGRIAEGDVNDVIFTKMSLNGSHNSDLRLLLGEVSAYEHGTNLEL